MEGFRKHHLMWGRAPAKICWTSRVLDCRAGNPPTAFSPFKEGLLPFKHQIWDVPTHVVLHHLPCREYDTKWRCNPWWELRSGGGLSAALGTVPCRAPHVLMPSLEVRTPQGRCPTSLQRPPTAPQLPVQPHCVAGSTDGSARPAAPSPGRWISAVFLFLLHS